MSGRISIVWGLLAAGTVALSATAAMAQAWKPEKAIEIVVPSGAGGGLDTAARGIQTSMQKLGIAQNVVVNNKPGGSGTVAIAYMNQHAGDPHYIQVQAPPFLTNPIVGTSQLGQKDATPLALMLTEEIIFSVSAKSDIKTGKDLAERLGKDASSLSVGISASPGGHSHIATALIVKAAGGDPKKLKTVVFQGGAEAATALLGGHIDVAVTPASSVLGHKAAGTLRIVGLTAEHRSKGGLADVPTFKEQGVNAVFSNWRLVAGPVKMTPAQIAWWDEALGRVAKSAEWAELADRNLWSVEYKSAKEMPDFVREQTEELTVILKEVGLAR